MDMENAIIAETDMTGTTIIMTEDAEDKRNHQFVLLIKFIF